VLELLDSEALELLVAVVECASSESDTVADGVPDDVSLVPSVADALELSTGASLQATPAARGTYTNHRVDTVAS
jgi:hypothetical protein